MIKYFTGCVVDAFDTGNYLALLHQANCFNTMNSGVARVIRERHPLAYEADCKTEKGDKAKLGTFSYAYIGVNDEDVRYIINLYGQYNYGKDGKKYTQVEKLEEAMRSCWPQYTVDSPSRGFKLCIPKLGCGLGGADWETELVPMIERQLISRGFEVHVYEK